MKEKLIQNFLRYLLEKGVSASSLKYYKSDISNFLTWTSDRKVDNKLIREYINSQRLTTPLSTLNRRLSTLRSYASFIGHDFMSGVENATSFRNVTKSWQETLLSKFEARPKLKNLFSKLLFNRPNWYRKYHSFALANYIHIAILILFSSLSGYAVYDQVFYSTDRSLAFPTALTRPNRFLSFQGRLTDNLGNPKTVATNIVFKLYSVSSGGTSLWDSGTCSITPDQDGIFSTLLGSSCGAEIASSVFSENAAIWLGVTVAADAEATPRIQIATVAYALNAETLQGFPAGTGTSTIPYIDSTGVVVLANASPKIQSTSGTFAVEGVALTLTTPNTSNGIVTINPDGTGTLNLTFEGAAAGGSANGFVNATNANITSGSLYSGTVASNATGYNFINFLSGVSPASVFSVQNDGDIVTAGDITIGGGNINTGNIALTIGDALTDSITLLTDGTGNGEVVLPNDSIGPNELLSTGQTDEYCLTYEGTGTTWEWQSCAAAGGGSWSALTVPTANLSLAHAGYTTAFTFDSVTTADAFALSSSSLTTGTILDLSSTSTAGGASGLSKILDITRSGTNANASHTAYGLYSAVTNTGTTSTNIGGYFSASGATNNYGLIVGAGNVGIGTTAPGGKLEINNSAANGATSLILRTNDSTAANSTIRWQDNSGNNEAAIGSNYNVGEAGALEFINGTTTNMIIRSGGNVGIGTTGPDAKLDSLSTTEQLRLTYTDGSVYSSFTTDSSGNLNIDNTGSKTVITDNLQVTGGSILNSVGTANIIFSATPTTTANTLSASNWLIENTANVGQAALMVNQTKAGDLFTASASGVTKFTIQNDGDVLLTNQLQLGNLSSAPTALGGGSMFFNTTTNTFQCNNGSTWFDCAGTLYNNTNATVANGSYITVTHNQNTNDLLANGWVYDAAASAWKQIQDFTHTIKQSLQNEFSDASTEKFNIDTSNTLMSNLNAYWTMNETSATAATQVTRNDTYGSNNLTDNRSATSYILSGTGKVNNAADLELTNGNFFEAADNTALSTGDIDFTVTAWVNLETKSTGTTQEVIVSKYESGSVAEYSLYYTGTTTDRLAFQTFNSSGTTVCNVNANNLGVPATSTWYYIVAWHDSTANTCNIQINNGTANSAAESGVPSDTTANFRIGAALTTEQAFTDGLIDEVGFWKKVLSTQEKTDLYNSGNGNSYTTTGNLIRTQTNLTNIELTPGINTGTGSDGSITVSSDNNINTANLISGRSCADGGDAVNYSVTALTSTTATLESAPSAGCLAAGDEVLLINLRGTNTAFSNVGNYETLRIASVASSTITFTSSKSKYYGDNATDDSNITLTTSGQVVMLQRVPNYTTVTISNAGTDFVPSAWTIPSGGANNGAGEGGIMFFRATGAVSIGASTTINANALGYNNGSNHPTGGGGDGGESICGVGGVGVSSGNGNPGAAGGGGSSGTIGGTGYCGGGGGAGLNYGTGGTGATTSGGSGGGGGGNNSGTASGGGGGGYGTGGEGGTGTTGGTTNGVTGGTNTSGNGGIGTASAQGGGGGGGSYGNASLTKLFYGSGGGGAGGVTLAPGGKGAGIVFIAANTVTVSGSVQSNGGAGNCNSHCGGGGAGGSVYLSGNTLSVGASLVTATGSTTGPDGGAGRIVTNYASSISGTASPAASSSLTGFNTYGLYHSPVISTPNSTNLESIRWETPVVPYSKVSFQTRSGATTSPTDGTWEAWRPFTITTNYLDLSNADTYTEYTGTNVTVADGDVTRNVDQFEDEDATAGNLTKLTSSTNGGTAEDTISSTDISTYDYITFWVRASQTGSVVKIGIGESAATEQEETINIDTTSTWQKVYWDISDIQSASRNAITKIRFTNLVASSNTMYIDNIRAEKLLTDQNHSIITSTPNSYFQYRAILTTTDTAYQPQVENITLFYNDGYKIQQVDANNVRLYNYTGTTQNLKLNATGAGFSSLANPWTDGGSYLYPTGYETLRVYDGAGTNYLSLSNSGTYAQLGWNGTAALSIASTGDISTTDGSGVIIGNPTQITLASGVIPELQVLGTGAADSSIGIFRTSANVNQGRLIFGKSRSGTIGSFTAVQSGDDIGEISFTGDDGTDYQSIAAYIRGSVDGTPGTGDMPGRLVFATSADGSETPTERMRIDSSGNVGIGVSSTANMKLRITADSTVTADSVYGIYLAGSQSTANSVQYNGLVINPSYTATSGNTLNSFSGLFSTPNNTSSGAITNLYGGYFGPSNASTGTIGNAYGIVSIFQKTGTGAVTGAYGTYSRVDNTNATGTISNAFGVYIGDSTETGTITNDWGLYQEDTGALNYFGGNVGFGMTGASVDVDVGGDIEYVGTITDVSDERLKENFANIDNPLEKILATSSYQFNMIGQDASNVELGFKAQEIQNILPELVHVVDPENGYLGINYVGMIPVITEAIKELNTKIENLGQSVIGKFGQVETKIISPVANSDLIIDLTPEQSAASKLVIKGVDDKEVASIDANGQIKSEELIVNSDATVSGTLYASTLYADNIESKRLEDIEELLREVETNQTLLAEASTWNVNTATESADLATYYELHTTNLYVTGQTALTSLFVSDNLTANKIDSLDTPLQIQSLAASPLEIMAGKISIDTDGNTKFLGNVEIAGDLKINNIIVANNIDPMATESATLIEGEVNSNSTAGKAVLTANSEKIRINNNKVSLNTLIYITPITSTQNKVLFVKAKGDGFFDIGFSDTLDTDVEFNWWIIDLQPSVNLINQ